MYYTGFFHGVSTGDKTFLNVSLSTGVIENFFFSFGREVGEATHPHKLELTLGSFNICSYCEGIQSLVYTGVCCLSCLFDSKHANYLVMSS